MTIEKDTTGTKKRGLGRGLGALFEDEEAVYPQVGAVVEGQAAQGSAAKRTLGVDQLEPGAFQPRKRIDAEAISELAASIAEHGVLQPILVRPKPGADGRYEIIAGERRWRAAQQAKLHEVPVLIKDFDDETTLEVALIENLQREDLNAIEEAQGYQLLIERFGHTQEKLAKAIGKSRPHVANMLRLLTLPDKVKTLVRESKLSAGHARALAGMEYADAEFLADEIIRCGLSVRDTEAMAMANPAKKARSKKSGASGGKDVDTLALEEEMTNRIGLKVSVDVKAGGPAGTLKIQFKTLDQLDELLRRLTQQGGKI